MSVPIYVGPRGFPYLKARQFAFASHTCSATYTTLIYLFGTRRPTRDNKMLPSQIGLHEPGYIFRVQHSPPYTLAVGRDSTPKTAIRCHSTTVSPLCMTFGWQL